MSGVSVRSDKPCREHRNRIDMIVKLLFIIAFSVGGRGEYLKQVVVISRHNIRTPLTTDLESLTPKNWPGWNGNTGYLTPKGRLLEHALGEYFSRWMIERNLLKKYCSKDEVFVFSNTRERTVETAKAFVEGAFGDCVDVYYKNMTKMDPVFNPILRNSSEEFIQIVKSEMQMKLNNIDLSDKFEELNKIVDFKNSLYCKTETICDLSEAESEIIVKANEEPDFTGALKIGNTLVDAFLMAYYDGMPLDQVAWGEIRTAEKWNSLLMLVKTYHELRFQTKPSDRDIASTLLKYLADVFQSNKKFYLLVGHDANILSLMSSLGFKDYDLQGQVERTPIGGKLVFQKWYDEEKEQDLLRVDYVYQSSEQIRDGVEASLENPPYWAMMEMENCDVDEKGYCLWNDFISILNAV